ncbi:MAG: sugar phosphate isomerase/epimerase [Alicyclobacillus sp.]|nr:sugar phosphate isomerase/epimerase [Alicyclobacillus sp.]
MKLGCCVHPDLLPEVIEAGFDFAELQVGTTVPTQAEAEWKSVKRALLSHGVPIRSFNVLLPQGVQVVGPEVSLTTIRPYLDRVFHRMAELGGRHVSFGSGGARRVPDRFDRQRASEQLMDFIQLLADIAFPYAMQVNIEFLNRKETNIILSLLEAADYARKVAHPSVKILADLYHMMEEEEPLTDLYPVAAELGYVHVADSDRLYPGSGTYPYASFFSILQEIGYDGPVSVECRWVNQVQEMKQAATFLRQFV